MAVQTTKDINSALSSLPIGIQVMEHEDNGVDAAKFLCRVPSTQTEAWLRVVEFLLRSCGEDRGWEFKACRRYFLKSSLVWGWELEFFWAEGGEVAGLMIGTIKASGSSVGGSTLMRGKEVQSMPLSGAEGIKDRNKPKPGSTKGASRVG